MALPVVKESGREWLWKRWAGAERSLLGKGRG